MKKIIALLIALILIQAMHLLGQSIAVLNKGENYTAERDKMVIMDKYTFGKYHYTAEKFDTLKKEVQEMDSLLQKKDAEQEKLISDYESEIKAK
jgi:hypothetical protein